MQDSEQNDSGVSPDTVLEGSSPTAGPLIEATELQESGRAPLGGLHPDSRRFAAPETVIQDSARLNLDEDSNQPTVLHERPPVGSERLAPPETLIQDSDRLQAAADSSVLSHLHGSSSNAPDLPPDNGLPAGGRIAQYELRRELARGGMGAVYLAYHPRLKREVALKVMLAGRDASQKELARFQREAEAAGRLQHPGIVAVHDVGSDRGVHYLVMDLVKGSSLDRVLKKDGPLPVRRAAELTQALAEALGYAHSHAILHRDMKPANVLLDANGRPKITDFGLAKNLDVEDELTKTGSIMGTPAYMPPEQARGNTQAVDRRADIYSLGATLYAFLTGKAPFSGAPIKIIYQVLRVDPVAPRSLRAEIDRDLETICLRCLEKDPLARYSTAQDLADDLGRYLAHEPILARRPTAVERLRKWSKRNRTLASVLVSAAALVFMISASALIVLPQRERARAASEARELARAEWEAANERSGLGPALGALQAAQRWYDLDPADPDAGQRLFDAACLLGEVALAGEQWELAEQCFAQAQGLGVNDSSAQSGLQRVRDARGAVARERREAVLAVLARAREGQLAREPDGLVSGVFELMRYAGPETSELLAAELDDVSTRLLAVEDAVVWEQVDIDNADAERVADMKSALAMRAERAGRAAIEGEDWKRYRYAIGQAAESRDQSWIDLRAMFAQRQRAVLGARLDAARVACDALARVEPTERSVFAIARYLECDWSPQRALVAARALLKLRDDAGIVVVQRAARNLGYTSAFGQAVLPLLADVGVVVELNLSPARTLHTRGEQRLNAGELEGAREDFEAVLKLEPDNHAAWSNLGSILAALGDGDGAREAHRRAVELSPENADYRYNLADSLLRLGDREQALAEFTRAVELLPNRALFRRKLGQLLEQMGDVQGALAQYDEALRNEPERVATWLARGNCYYLQGDPQRAFADYERAANLEPDNPNALRERGYCRAKLGELDLGVNDLRRAVEIQPKDLKAWVMLGDVLISVDPAEAAVAFGRALELNPNDGMTLARRGFARLALGEPRPAIADFERALSLQPELLPALSGHADALLQIDEYARGVAAYDALLAVEPRIAGAWNNRGCALQLLERFPEALASFERGLELEPEWGMLWSNRGEILEALDRGDDALESYGKAINLDADMIEPRLFRGAIHLRAYRHADAHQDAEAALAIDADSAKGLALRGRALRGLGDTQGAARDLRRALELEPELAGVAEELDALD